MTVVAAEVIAIRLPLHEPFVVAYGRFEDMPSILLRIVTDDGVEGWGEAVPDPHVTAESFEGAFASLCSVLLPCLEGLTVFDSEVLHHRMDRALRGNPSIKAAVDIALHDAWARALGHPLFQLLGGRAHATLTQPRVISIKSPDEVAADATAAVEAGFTELKLKVGRDDGLDVQRIRALHRAAGGRAALRVDANQGWDRSSALAVIGETADCSIQWYEQPLPADDVDSMAELRRATPARLMIDEGVHTPADLVRAIRASAADLVNIKLMKAGGIRPALELASVASAAGMPCQIGSMVESAVATAAGLQVAVARSGIISNELVGPAMIAQDVGEIPVDAGRVAVPDGPGLGIIVDEERVRELTVSRHQWRAPGCVGGRGARRSSPPATGGRTG